MGRSCEKYGYTRRGEYSEGEDNKLRRTARNAIAIEKISMYLDNVVGNTTTYMSWYHGVTYMRLRHREMGRVALARRGSSTPDSRKRECLQSIAFAWDHDEYVLEGAQILKPGAAGVSHSRVGVAQGCVNSPGSGPGVRIIGEPGGLTGYLHVIRLDGWLSVRYQVPFFSLNRFVLLPRRVYFVILLNLLYSYVVT